MSTFTQGLVVGCFAGAIGMLLLFLAIHNLPDGERLLPLVKGGWRGTAIIMALMGASGISFILLDLRRVAFATSVLMLLVFITAHFKGMLFSWLTLAVATVALCLILPPAHSLSVADPQDRMLLVFFMLCGAIGTRLIAQKQNA